ncbi:unnamed protein product [Sphagnum jensenii]|uniref:Uncharacterized protein n=1 Tax=Sphagnum jensenii TaxID=128206 RepID=A0ABP1BH53_9BRYO
MVGRRTDDVSNDVRQFDGRKFDGRKSNGRKSVTQHQRSPCRSSPVNFVAMAMWRGKLLQRWRCYCNAVVARCSSVALLRRRYCGSAVARQAVAAMALRCCSCSALLVPRRCG